MNKLANYNPTLLCDFYKLSHRVQYPKGTEKVYSTWTCRCSRLEGVNGTVFFGLQKFIKEYLIDYFNKNFFDVDFKDVETDYKRIIKYTLGEENPETSHLKELHELGYLPIKITALKEGTITPIRVPCLTIENTQSKFFWLTNFLETLMSSELWISITSSTIALEYRKIVEDYANKTCDDDSHIPFQCHDFSFRGMSSVNSAINSSMGHLLSFCGTDTVPSVLAMEKYYNANVEKELIGSSIPATEHSVMCSYGKVNELDLFRHLINEVYPKGIFSVVSDTWDLWKVVGEYLPILKDEVIARDGKVVLRPDSGKPEDIICGNIDIENLDEVCDTIKDIKYYYEDMAYETLTEHQLDEVYICKFKDKIYRVTCIPEWTSERGVCSDKDYCILMDVEVEVEEYEVTMENKGVIEILWDIFGGTINSKGYKVLDNHIGCIYGDSITLERCKEICERLEKKGFASSNIVLGVGSFSYQYNTRDTFGQAMKATYAVVNGEERLLFKDPITDNGTKKSQRGMVVVYEDNGEIKFKDGFTKEAIEDIEEYNLLETVFEDGELLRDEKLINIRNRVLSFIK